MSLFSILSLGSNALSVHQAASSVNSHNIENVNTPGYSRQRANLQAMLPAFRLGGSFIGQGVGLNTVSQARDFGAEKQFAAAQSSSAESKARSEALQSLSALDPQGADSIGTAMADFYSAMRALAQNPQDPSLRQAALGQVRAASLAFNRTAASVDGARDAIDSKLTGGLSEINQLAQQMAQLNKQVRVARGSGAEPNDLLDARQQVQDKLIGLTGVVPIPTSDGDVNLALPNGTALVTADQASSVSLVGDATNGGHLSVRFTAPSGGSAVDVTNTIKGTWGGWTSARDGAMRTAETSLDTLAFDFANAVNTVHAAGFGTDGVSGRNLFDVSATASGAAASLSLAAVMNGDPNRLGAASSAATVPGDGTNLQALIDTERQTLSQGLDGLSQWSSLLTNYGADAARASTAAEADTAVLNHVTGLRESVSGVSIDEEMIELTKSQRAFEAVMKVIQTTNEMLDVVMSLKQ